jgi:hypothetical protein
MIDNLEAEDRQRLVLRRTDATSSSHRQSPYATAASTGAR